MVAEIYFSTSRCYASKKELNGLFGAEPHVGTSSKRVLQKRYSGLMREGIWGVIPTTNHAGEDTFHHIGVAPQLPGPIGATS